MSAAQASPPTAGGAPTPRARTRPSVLVRAGRASVTSGARLAAWAELVGPVRPEAARARTLARLGGVSATAALTAYLLWRVLFTLPAGGPGLVAGVALVVFEAVPLVALLFRVVTLWDLDTDAPPPVHEAGPGRRVVVLVTTTDEPAEVVAPTVAAACDLAPVHQTWVLDDGDRPWLRELCALYGARHVRRDGADGGAPGSVDHALHLLQQETAAGAEPVDVLALLGAGHVPLPTFLTATLGWFDDPEVALVQAPQSSYDAGAFDDDGETGEQGAFFHVLLPSRQRAGSGPFWCGSTSLVRTSALAGVGGIATGAAAAHLATTLALLRAGGRTVYHHQVLAVGLAPTTPHAYLEQRHRSGVRAMQLLVQEGLWPPGPGLSWRTHLEYLVATLGRLAGVGTVLGLLVPAAVLLSGVQASTAPPLLFLAAFLVMWAVRVWGVELLHRRHVRWGAACALRVLQVPVGLSCLWWLLTRRPLPVVVGSTVGADGRSRDRVPAVLVGMIAVTAAVLAVGVAGLTGRAPWQTTPAAAVAPGAWLVLALLVALLGVRRVHDLAHATSRRSAYRAPVRAVVSVNGLRGELLDVSVSGVAVRLPPGALGAAPAEVTLQLPGAAELTLEAVRLRHGDDGDDVALRVVPGHWDSYRALALWLFHTPPGVVDGLPPHTPAVAALEPVRRSRRPVLVREHG